MEPVSEQRFEQLVEDALEAVPDDLWQRVENVAIVVSDRHAQDPELLGLYEGVPLTERWDYAGLLPDRITLYRLALCEYVSSEEELREEVARTVIHEIAHYAGIDDDELHELGWG